MNIRLSQGQVRVRISKEEAALALQTGKLREEFRLLDGVVLNCTILVVETIESLCVAPAENGISLTASKEAIGRLLEGGASKQAALSFIASDLNYTLEIDLFSFKRKR